MMAADIRKKLEVYQQACRKGTDWLLGYLNPDGSIGPAQEWVFYYRVPWTFALMGETAAAGRMLDWIKGKMFTPDGAFEGFSPQGLFEERYGSYPLACLLVGATHLHRLDIVVPGTRSLLTWQDPKTGGFRNCREAADADDEQEIFPTCQAGMTLLLVGQVDAARKAGGWLERVWSLQPDRERMLYAVYTSDKGLVTDFPPDQEALYVTRKDYPWQHHFNGGISAAFLTQLHLATGEAEWLNLARAYQAFSMTTDACQFESMQVCKSGWGSGLLYLVTREEAYLDWTVRLGDWLIANQLEDGHWENTKYWTPEPTDADNIMLTAEFVMHVANIISYVSV